MNYDESIDYLFSLQRMGARAGTRVITSLLARMGNPQDTFPSVLVAGTNGKGSTAAFLASILRAAGLRVGRYTSPHLVRFEERISRDGEMIPPAEVARITTAIRPHAEALAAKEGEEHRPSFFETATAIAFQYFHDQRVDLAVLEVGMGGRLDATSVVNAVACLFTPIDLDHREHLGDRIEEIALEKAGILKPGSRAITAPQAPEALAVLRRAAAEQGAALEEAEGVWRMVEGEGNTVTFVSVIDPARKMEGLTLSLRGRHQRINALLAVAAASRLPGIQGRDLEPAIRRGLAETRWPGRCEIAAEHPTLLLDGAHNPAGARVLRQFLIENYTSKGKKVVLVFGAMQDKDLPEIMQPLFPCAARVILTRAETPRAADPMILESLARRFHTSVLRAPGLSAALAAARTDAGPDGVVCVTGSLYLVGDVKALLEGIEPRSRQAL